MEHDFDSPAKRWRFRGPKIQKRVIEWIVQSINNIEYTKNLMATKI